VYRKKTPFHPLLLFLPCKLLQRPGASSAGCGLADGACCRCARVRWSAANRGVGLPSVPAQLAPDPRVCGQWASTGGRRHEQGS
jgi:hypothetical protein